MCLLGHNLKPKRTPGPGWVVQAAFCDGLVPIARLRAFKRLIGILALLVTLTVKAMCLENQ
jgi:hypothetical protein